MGFLSEGQTLNWEETQKWVDYVREHGVEQFLSLYRNNKDRVGDVALWGDEVEYSVVQVNPEERTVRLLLTAAEYLPILQEPENKDPRFVLSNAKSSFVCVCVYMSHLSFSSVVFYVLFCSFR
jgi:glutamate--cysteine ligase catalytic subunit